MKSLSIIEALHLPFEEPSGNSREELARYLQPIVDQIMKAHMEQLKSERASCLH
jgi:hypothetical protein